MTSLVERLRAAANGLNSFYQVGAIERIPAGTMEEAADTIDALCEAIESARELMQEAKGFEGPNGGPVTDHLDFAESNLIAALAKVQS
jgi:hypothetical protein